MSKEKDFVTMADLGNHIECPFCPQKDAKITDLEAKLAESEKKQEYLFSSMCEYVYQIEELKQQLAEKDKEIEFLKLQSSKYLEKGMIIVRTQDLEAIDAKHNQSKTEFAIQQLQRVKEIFVWGKDNGYLTPKNALNVIDQIIKELEEE